MLYFATPSTKRIRDAMTAGVLGCMTSPAQGNLIDPSWTWAVDTGAYKNRWQPDRWLAYLDRYAAVGKCVFATVPDRLADPIETRRLWDQWATVVTDRGYRPAYVAQDDQHPERVPWDQLTVLFIGGTTEYKRGPDAMRLAATAQARGKWVHWGRINSRRRFAMAAANGDSADGTFLTFGPDKNLPQLVGWLNTITFDETEHLRR